MDEHGADIPNMWGVPLKDFQGEHAPVGMTLRDKFAMAALSRQVGSPADIARFSYEVADAMLAERSK